MNAVPFADIGTIFADTFRVIERVISPQEGELFRVEDLRTRRALGLFWARGEPWNPRRTPKIQHRNIVRFTDAGADDRLGSFAILDDIVNTLDVWAGRGPLDPWWASEIVMGVGHALAAGHAAGDSLGILAASDVLILVDRYGDHTAKLLGFDLPNRKTEAERMQHIVSDLFLAPECLLEKSIGPSADVWTLGLMGFYAFTGEYFWRLENRKNAAARLRQILFEPLPSLATRARECGVEALLPPGFDVWFSRCVHRDKTQRWQNAGEAMAAWQTDPEEEALFVEMRRPGANPELRAIYADWLEARGEGTRAAWMRSRFRA